MEAGGFILYQEELPLVGHRTRCGDEDHVIARAIEPLAGLENDEWPGEASLELLHVVHVGVVDERAGPRRREQRVEGLPGVDHRRCALAVATEPGCPAVITLQLDAVPVDSGRLREPVAHRDDVPGRRA